MKIAQLKSLFPHLPLIALTCIVLIAGSAYSQTAIRSDFDHDSTGFRLDGAHLVAGCGNCHAEGIFSGTLRKCADCHKVGGTVTATPQPVRHVLTTQECEACHATRSFLPLARMDHTQTVGDCVSCHDNQSAPGKPVDHPPTSDQCDSCHLTVAFSPVLRFDHTGIVNNCFSCHNGTVASGQAGQSPADYRCMRRLSQRKYLEFCRSVQSYPGARQLLRLP